MCHDKQESLVDTIEGLIEVWKGGEDMEVCPNRVYKSDVIYFR